MADWVVLELTPQGEDEDPEVLQAAVRRILKDSEIFVPASISKVGDNRVVHKLIDNYVFVRRDKPDAYYYRAEGTKYVATVLTAVNGRTRQVSTVRDADVLKMRRQIQVETDQGIEIGDEVEVMSGAYKSIRGRVIEEIQEKDSVQIFISLRSKQDIVTLPRSFLRFVPPEGGETTTFSPFRAKYLRITDWFRRAEFPLSVPVPSISSLEAGFSNLVRLQPWADGVSALAPDIIGRRRIEDTPYPEIEPLEKLSGSVTLLYRTHQLQREIELAPLLELPLAQDPLEELLEQVGAISLLALPFSTLCRQVEAGDELSQLADPSDVEELESLFRFLKVYGESAEAIKRLKYQIGQVESKLKKAEQEDAKERKRRAAKRRR